MMESAPQFAYQAPTYFPFPVPFHLQNAYLTLRQVSPVPVVAASASSSVAAPVAPPYPAAYSFPQHQQVVRDKWTGKTKGYGLVSFAKASDLAAALKEMNGKYDGNRPIKLRKTTWKDRIDHEALEKKKNQVQKKPKALKKAILHK